MITKTQKKKIMKVLGFRYSAPIQAELRALGIVNSNGKEHSANMIAQVMNGLPHDEIEGAIVSAVFKKNAEIKKRKQILKHL